MESLLPAVVPLSQGVPVGRPCVAVCTLEGCGSGVRPRSVIRESSWGSLTACCKYQREPSPLGVFRWLRVSAIFFLCHFQSCHTWIRSRLSAYPIARVGVCTHTLKLARLSVDVYWLSISCTMELGGSEAAPAQRRRALSRVFCLMLSAVLMTWGVRPRGLPPKEPFGSSAARAVTMENVSRVPSHLLTPPVSRSLMPVVRPSL